MKKANVAIIGTGNIGSDLLMKIQRSKVLKCTLFTGINSRSENILRAKKMGIFTSAQSIYEIEKNPDICDIVFDATSAKTHILHAPILRKLKKFTIDMTPSKVGRMCSPFIDIDDCIQFNNINLISCGAQAILPIAQEIKKTNPDTEYLELVTSISSYSAGMGTRKNIDEYTQSTKEALAKFSQIKKMKTILILNPANPPISMHNTLYVKMKNPKLLSLKKSIDKVVYNIQKYVPGYQLVLKPTYQNGVVVLMIQVTGHGDFLPSYAGNLDIMNCAGVFVAEEYAKKKNFKK